MKAIVAQSRQHKLWTKPQQRAPKLWWPELIKNWSHPEWAITTLIAFAEFALSSQYEYTPGRREDRTDELSQGKANALKEVPRRHNYNWPSHKLSSDYSNPPLSPTSRHLWAHTPLPSRRICVLAHYTGPSRWNIICTPQDLNNVHSHESTTASLSHLS